MYLIRKIFFICLITFFFFCSMGNYFAQESAEETITEPKPAIASPTKPGKEVEGFIGEAKLGFSSTHLWRGYNFFHETYFAEGFVEREDQSTIKQIINYYGFTINPEITLKLDMDKVLEKKAGTFFLNLWGSFDIIPNTRDVFSDVERDFTVGGQTQTYLVLPQETVQNDGSPADLEIYDQVRLTIGYQSPFSTKGWINIGFIYYGYIYGTNYSGEDAGTSKLEDTNFGPEWEVFVGYSYQVPIPQEEKNGKLVVNTNVYIDENVNFYLNANLTYFWKPVWVFALESSVGYGQWLRPKTTVERDNQNRLELAADDFVPTTQTALGNINVIDSLLVENWSHVDVGLKFHFYPIKTHQAFSIFLGVVGSLRIFYNDDTKYDINYYDIADNFFDGAMQQVAAAAGGTYDSPERRNPFTERPMIHVAFYLGGAYKF